MSEYPCTYVCSVQLNMNKYVCSVSVDLVLYHVMSFRIVWDCFVWLRALWYCFILLYPFVLVRTDDPIVETCCNISIPISLASGKVRLHDC